jgi:hypothetical protein
MQIITTVSITLNLMHEAALCWFSDNAPKMNMGGPWLGSSSGYQPFWVMIFGSLLYLSKWKKKKNKRGYLITNPYQPFVPDPISISLCTTRSLQMKKRHK